MWRRNEDSKDVEEINILDISEVSKDNDEHNISINKDDIHYKEKQDGDIKKNTRIKMKVMKKDVVMTMESLMMKSKMEI